MTQVFLTKRTESTGASALQTQLPKTELPQALGSSIPPDIEGIGKRWVDSVLLKATLPAKKTEVA